MKSKYPMQCFWFTTLVSKQSHLSSIYKTLNKVNAGNKTIDMAQAKKSRISLGPFLVKPNKNSGSLNNQMIQSQSSIE
jgi:23S rRNA (adenine1618-N6)-methyltransferase